MIGTIESLGMGVLAVVGAMRLFGGIRLRMVRGLLMEGLILEILGGRGIEVVTGVGLRGEEEAVAEAEAGEGGEGFGVGERPVVG